MFELLWPICLFVLPLPWLLRYLLPAKQQSGQDSALRVPFWQQIQQLSDQQQRHIVKLHTAWIWYLAIAAWCLLVLAAARPQWVGELVQLPLSGRDLLLAIDLSGSMETVDFVVNQRAIDRLTAVKLVASDFIARREGDRIGLILFGDQAYLHVPLTFDRETVKTLLLESMLGLAGRATAIGDAIGLAVKRLENDLKNKDKILILMTDGANTAGAIAPLKAAELAAGAGLKIYTIGIGADAMIRHSFFGLDQSVNPSRDLDEATLTKIAEMTGGKYFRARDTAELQQIYTELDRLEPVEREQHSFRPAKSLFHWPLALSLLLALLVWYQLPKVTEK